MNNYLMFFLDLANLSIFYNFSNSTTWEFLHHGVFQCIDQSSWSVQHLFSSGLPKCFADVHFHLFVLPSDFEDLNFWQTLNKIKNILIQNKTSINISLEEKIHKRHKIHIFSPYQTLQIWKMK